MGVKSEHINLDVEIVAQEMEAKEQEMSIYNVVRPSMKEYEDMYGLTVPEGFYDN